MSIAIKHTKLVVRDLKAAEHFYRAMGLKVVSRNIGGEGDVAQEQSWLSESGDASSHLLVLTRFLNFPPPSRPIYPGEAWLVFTVSNVDALLENLEAEGGRILQPGQDIAEHHVRAAVVTDPEGHVIEVVGPINPNGGQP
jgi:catechol 2,3-dioxygenase-like lactoylglutathione lyase family enzyme